jgi:hypothetical protein
MIARVVMCNASNSSGVTLDHHCWIRRLAGTTQDTLSCFGALFSGELYASGRDESVPINTTNGSSLKADPAAISRNAVQLAQLPLFAHMANGRSDHPARSQLFQDDWWLSCGGLYLREPNLKLPGRREQADPHDPCGRIVALQYSDTFIRYVGV